MRQIMADCKESDWKLFRVKIVEWQENYMNKLNHKLAKLLTDEKVSAADRFWKAEKIITREKKSKPLKKSPKTEFTNTTR